MGMDVGMDTNAREYDERAHELREDVCGVIAIGRMDSTWGAPNTLCSTSRRPLNQFNQTNRSTNQLINHLVARTALCAFHNQRTTPICPPPTRSPPLSS